MYLMRKHHFMMSPEGHTTLTCTALTQTHTLSRTVTHDTHTAFSRTVALSRTYARFTHNTNMQCAHYVGVNHASTLLTLTS